MLMNQSLNHPNDRQDNMCLTSPDKSHISNQQRSPSDSLGSKTETDKNRSAKSRNKEGIYHAGLHRKLKSSMCWLYPFRLMVSGSIAHCYFFFLSSF